MNVVMKNRQHAFSIIELLVVVAIIAVLIALLMPVFIRVRDAARTVTCISNQRQLGLAFAAYASINRDVVPSGNCYTDGVTSDANRPYWMWPLAQIPDLRWSVAGRYRSNGPPPPGHYGGTNIRCPNHSLIYASGSSGGVSYAVFTYATGVNGEFRNKYQDPTFYFDGVNLTAIKEPSRIMRAIDGVNGNTAMALYNGKPQAAILVNAGGLANRSSLDRVWVGHPNNTANVLFMDGHVENCQEGWLVANGIIHYWETDGTLHP